MEDTLKSDERFTAALAREALREAIPQAARALVESLASVDPRIKLRAAEAILNRAGITEAARNDLSAAEGALRAGYIGALRWRNEDGDEVAAIGVDCRQGETLALFYTWTRNDTGERQEMRYSVSIDWTICTYGGTRPWFRCPACGRRARFLYLARQHFVCRTCAKLTYRSRRVHRDTATEGFIAEERIDDLYAKLARARSPRCRAILERRIALAEAAMQRNLEGLSAAIERLTRMR